MDIIQKILNIGSRPGQSHLDQIRNQLLNMDCWAAFLIPLVLITYYLANGLIYTELIIFSVSFLPLSLWCLWLNQRGHQLISILILNLSAFLVICAATVMLGNESRMPILLLPISLSFFIFMIDHRALAYVLFGLFNATCFVLMVWEIRMPGFPDLLPHDQTLVNNAVILAGLIAFIYKAGALVLLYQNSLEGLEKQKKDLQLSQKAYRNFVRLSTEGIYHIGFHTPISLHDDLKTQARKSIKEAYFVECNDAFARAIGFESGSELFGKSLSSIDPDQFRGPLGENYEAFAMARFRIKDMEFEKTDKEGKSVWFIENTIGIVENHHLVRVWGTCQNITERKSTQTALRESEQRYRSVFENTQLGIAIANMDYRFVDLNPAFCKMIGYEKEELLQMGIGDITREKEKPQNIISAKAVKATGKGSVALEKEYIRKNGKIMSTQTHLNPVRSKDGDPLYLATIRDITELKKAEKALQKSELRHRLLFEHAFDGILIVDVTNLAFIDCNQKLWEYFGESNKEAFLKRHPLDYCPPFQPDGTSSKKHLKIMFRQALRSGRIEYEWQHVRKDGTVFYTSISAIRLDLEDESIFIAIFKDITEQKRQESVINSTLATLNRKNRELQRYIESNMQLEHFAYIASHDLQAPLRTIISFSQLLEQRAKGRLLESEREFLDFIIKSTWNMKQLIEDLLTYSLVDSKPYNLTKVDTLDLLESILSELQVNIREKKATFEFNNLPRSIVADQTKLRQLFQNLISNAIKFHHPSQPPHIMITGEETPHSLTFSVKDNGIGIRNEYHKKIFLLFRKLHAPSKYQGTGIGLALCKRIVEQHDGEIWLESEEGKGSNFQFTISKNLQ